MQACDYVMLDFMRISGITGWLQAAGACSAANIPLSTHLYPEVATHVLRVSETAHLLEWQDWANPVLQELYVLRNGKLHIPNRPGLGLDWNEDIVAKHHIV
jgi:mandelate racemase